MIHILYADISGAEEGLYRKLYERASPERRRRADGFLRWEDRLRCVAADVLLQIALGRSDLPIETNEFGKPFVSDVPGFHFNLSHSGRYVVLAYGDREVGVDVQQHTAGNTDALARRWFSPEEYAYAEGSRQRFYEIWTAKESYVKYLGKGLCMDLRAVSVLNPGPDLCFQHISLSDDYSLCFCSAGGEYTLTMAELL